MPKRTVAKRTVGLRLKDALLFWDKYTGVSSDEDEDDSVIGGPTGSSKRPKWMEPVHPSNSNMFSDGPHSSRSSKSVKVSKKKSMQRLMDSEVKENETEEIEVIDLENNGHMLVEARPPLSNLAVRAKTKPERIHVPERKENGAPASLFHSFTTPLRSSKTNVHKLTALDETFKMEDRLKYSKLLAEYHMSARCGSSSSSGSKVQEVQQSPRTCRSRGNLLKSDLRLRPLETIDLTKSDERKCTRIPVKPWQPQASGSDDDDVKVIEERSVPRVNSLQRRLSENCLVSPQWIMEMQKKYSEREREAMRQVEEERIKKELYAKHNYSKHIETLDERIRKHLSITDIVLEDTEAVTPLPEITPEMKEHIDRALHPNPSDEVLVKGFGQLITRRDMQTLNKLNWLNDEVINFYMSLLIERGEREKYMSVYAFNTFFYPKLITHGYNSLRRWTKKVDIFAKQMVFVPIHLGMHWCMATIDFRDCTVRYYDSMGSENNRCLNALLKYLSEESMDKKNTPYNISKWKMENVKNIPQQMNGSDCGMFSCMFAEYLSRDAKITFAQKDMPYFRQKMVYEILTKRLLL